MLLTILSGMGWLAFALGFAGVVYSGLASLFVQRFFSRRGAVTSSAADEPVAILKPLHGAESGLRRNLESLYRQEGRQTLEIVFGVQDAADPARAIVEALAKAHSEPAQTLCIDPTEHGQNRKVSNLINMTRRTQSPILVLSDSDIGVPPDYVSQVVEALLAPGVGVVTCPYFGSGEAGFWSRVAAMGLSYQFLTNVITGVCLGLAQPCMGSTIAIRRETLERIGGFDAFRDVLADDYAIGAAVRALGLKSVTAPVLVSHSSVEMRLGEVFRHELRWAKTVRGVDPGGHAGSIVTHPLPLAVIAALMLGFSTAPLILVLAAFVARLWLKRTVDRAIGASSGAWWLLPLRDMLSFSVLLASFFVRSVEWRGAKFQVSADGDLKPV